MARILVVDDSDDMRRLFVDVLGRGHHETVEAANGIIGFDHLMSSPFDLAILDVMMPDLDGLTLCRMLRDVPGFSAFPIIVVSGASTEGAAISAGADVFLNKPFRPSRLLSIIDDLITNGRADRPDGAARPVMPGITGPDITGLGVVNPDTASADSARSAVAPATSPRPRSVRAYRRTNGQTNGQAAVRSAGASTRRAKSLPEQSPRDTG